MIDCFRRSLKPEDYPLAWSVHQSIEPVATGYICFLTLILKVIVVKKTRLQNYVEIRLIRLLNFSKVLQDPLYLLGFVHFQVIRRKYNQLNNII